MSVPGRNRGEPQTKTVTATKIIYYIYNNNQLLNHGCGKTELVLAFALKRVDLALGPPWCIQLQDKVLLPQFQRMSRSQN